MVVVVDSVGQIVIVCCVDSLGPCLVLLVGFNVNRLILYYVILNNVCWKAFLYYVNFLGTSMVLM